MSALSLISTKEASRLSAYAMGIGNELNMKDVARPKGMLEHVVNIFTLGGVRREKEEVYKSVISELRTVLRDKNTTPDSLQNLEKIELHFDKMSIRLRPDSRCNALQIIVSRGNEKAERFVPDSNFTALCSSIILREKLGLSRDNDLLTPSGEINFTDIHETHLNTNAVFSVLSDVPPQIEFTTTTENADRLLNKYYELSKDHFDIGSSVSNGSELKTDISANKKISTDIVSLIESCKNPDYDSGPVTGYSSGRYSDSDVLSLYSTLEGDAESNTTLYHNMRNRKDISVKVS